MSELVHVSTNERTLLSQPGYVERLTAERRLRDLNLAVDKAAVNGLVKIRMHHGAVIFAAKQNAVAAIERGQAELIQEVASGKSKNKIR